MCVWHVCIRGILDQVVQGVAYALLWIPPSTVNFVPKVELTSTSSVITVTNLIIIYKEAWLPLCSICKSKQSRGSFVSIKVLIPVVNICADEMQVNPL